MVISRVQALAIALGLTLVGVAVATGAMPLSAPASDTGPNQIGKTMPSPIDAALDGSGLAAPKSRL